MQRSLVATGDLLGIGSRSPSQRPVQHPTSRHRVPVQVKHEGTDEDVGEEEEDEDEEKAKKRVNERGWRPPTLHQAPGRFRLGRTHRRVNGRFIRKAFRITIQDADQAGIDSHLKPGQQNKQYCLYHLVDYAIKVEGMDRHDADAAAESEKDRKASSPIRYELF
ncbi:hypothetical protein DPSP01_010996 [Paraphaeosphaeria sporulosa]